MGIDIDIKEVHLRVGLLQAATLQKAVLISDVAREMKVRVTDLMLFIRQNPKLFKTEEVWSWKTERYTEMTRFGKQKCQRTVKDKCKGLGIKAVFLRPEDNDTTDEWLAVQKVKFARTIWLSDWNNYGHIEGQFVAEDKKEDGDKKRTHLWRNTADKIRELKALGILHETTFYIGGAFDCSSHKKDTAINAEGIRKAESLGWTIK